MRITVEDGQMFGAACSITIDIAHGMADVDVLLRGAAVQRYFTARVPVSEDISRDLFQGVITLASAVGSDVAAHLAQEKAAMRRAPQIVMRP